MTRVESGSDDPGHLGHFFGGSSGSHMQTKLSGCRAGSGKTMFGEHPGCHIWV